MAFRFGEPSAPGPLDPAEAAERARIMWKSVFGLVSVGVVLTVAGGVFASIADPDPTWQTRSWDDPMVLTHVMLAFPLFVALTKRMWVTAGLTFVSLLMSTIYHVWFEHPNSKVLDVLDETFAIGLLVWVLRLIVDMLFFRGPRHGGTKWLLAGLVTGAIALVFFYLPGQNLPDDGRHNCYNEKLHPFWHLLGFFAIGAFTMAWRQHDATGRQIRWWQQP